MFDRLESAVGPILPGLAVAGLFVALLWALRIRYRGQSLAARIRRPTTIFYISGVFFALAVLARLYLTPFYRLLYLTSLVVLTLAIVLAVSTFLFDVFLGHYRRVHVPVILRDIVILVVYVVVVVIVVGQEGVDVTSIVTTSAVLTAVIGFALQDLLSNIISGLAIEIERPFSVGDWVKFDQQEGRVLEINWRSTKIETLHRDYVIIPNNVATRSAIINFSAPDPVHRRRITVGLPYGAPPNRVKASLLAAVRGVPGVEASPAPYVHLRSYDDFSISYTLYFYLSDLSRREGIEDQVRSRLWYQLKRDGLSIPFPIRDVNLRTVDPEDEARERARQEAERMALLEQVPFLEPLSRADRETLAGRLRPEFYAAGETILRTGDPGGSFFIIADGEVEVRIGGAAGTQQAVATLGRYDFFGEMSLMTGAERTADVVALTDTQCLVLDKAAFQSIIRSNEALVDAISQRLAARQEELAAAHSRRQAKATPPPKAELQRSLASRIRRFFQISGD